MAFDFKTVREAWDSFNSTGLSGTGDKTSETIFYSGCLAMFVMVSDSDLEQVKRLREELAAYHKEM